MNLQSLFFVSLVSPLMVTASFAEIPKHYSYRCANSLRQSLYVAFEKGGARISEISSDHKLQRTLNLPDTLTLSDKSGEPLRIFLSPKDGQPGEIREQIVRGQEAQSVRLTLLFPSLTLSGWTCVYTGAAMKVHLLSSTSEIAVQDGFLVGHWVSKLTESKTLFSQSIGQIRDMLARYAREKTSLNGTAGEGPLKAAFTSLNLLAPEALEQLRTSLTENEKHLLDEIETLIAYEKFPPMQRWVFWASLKGESRDVGFRISIREFLKSTLSKEEDMRKFFQDELRSTLIEMSQADVDRIAAPLNASEKLFVESLWQNTLKSKVQPKKR